MCLCEREPSRDFGQVDFRYTKANFLTEPRKKKIPQEYIYIYLRMIQQC